MSEPLRKYRKDYRAPDYFIDHIDLRVDIGAGSTRVDSVLDVRRNPDAPAGRPLRLDGEHMELLAVAVDGRALADGEYTSFEGGLELPALPERCRITISNRIHPESNTALEGLYQSGDMLCTQCEAEGFRRITYFLDRPDVMASYRTTIIADCARYPVLLSNGNRVDEGDTEDGRHWVCWDDPHPKPSYLFALVAGDLACVSDTYTTSSGREVSLQLYVDPGNEDKCPHALESLRQAMAWDERVYGLEYDLDVYMIVAASAFNMGAMENKGLNLFNDKYVLANPQTATDQDFDHVRDVVGHEYFHNWTGNRVTLRDWFQLSLKESLTVFREQSFSADMGSPATRRINQVRHLRSIQFPEDSGPMAHPVRPESYIEMNNFYTMTVYEKGAEVIRMMHTLLGDAAFVQGVKDYLARFDGQAVTIEDFIATLEASSGADLQQFRLWYSQAGTPELRVEDQYDPERREYTLFVSQRCPATPGQPDKAPMHIPLSVGLLDADGNALPLALDGDRTGDESATSRLLHVRQPSEVFRFRNVPTRPVPSLLRDFSAPVKLYYDYTPAQLRLLAQRDQDAFVRWEAGQQRLLDVLVGLTQAHQEQRPFELDDEVVDMMGAVIADTRTDAALVAEMLLLPGEVYLGEQMATIDVDAVVAAHQWLKEQLARRLYDAFLARYRDLAPSGAYRFEGAEVARRRLRNTCLAYLCAAGRDEAVRLAKAQFDGADNMTATVGAMSALNDATDAARGEVFDAFYERWRGDALVVDKWMTLNATSRRPGALERVIELMSHESFDMRNPNRVRALVGAFCAANMAGFHRADGEGYRFLADQVLAIDELNAQLAARLVSTITRWRRYAEPRASLMRAQVERIAAATQLSRDVFEQVSQSLKSG